MKRFILCIFFMLMPLQNLFADCVPLAFEDLEALVKKEPRTQVVFFASWCVSCKKHFVQKNVAKRIFIATYDEKDAAEEVIRKFQIQDPCYLDKGIAQRLGIKSLPQTRQWSEGRFL